MADLVVELPGFFLQEVRVGDLEDFTSLNEHKLKLIEEAIMDQCRESIIKSLIIQTTDNDTIEIDSIYSSSSSSSEKSLPTDGKLIEVIYQVQSKFMQQEDIRNIFDFTLERLLRLIDSELGFMGEIHHDEVGKPAFQLCYFNKVSGNNIEEGSKNKYGTCSSVDIHQHHQPLDEKETIYKNMVHSLFETSISSKEPFIVNNVKRDVRNGNILPPPDFPVIKNFLVIPFVHQNEVIGLFAVGNRQGGYFEEIIDYLKPLTVTCCNMIMSLRISNSKKRAEKELVIQLEQKVLERTSELEEINRRLEKEIIEKTLISQKLEQAKIEAELSSETKSQFVACISHELRTPMNSVLGMARLLMETELTQQQQEYLSIIHESGSTLLLLINDILDFSKIESGQLAIESRSANVSLCIEKCIEHFSTKAKEKNIEILYDYNIGPYECLVIDESRLSQIFFNLIGNSIKFTDPNGYIHISSKVERMADGEVVLRFGVKDNGIGIKSEYKENIFKPFVQGDTSITRKYGGTGLGLAIAKKIVELLGGSIWFESEFGKGTSFYFEIKGKKLEALHHPPIETINMLDKLSSMNALVLDENCFRASCVTNCLLKPFKSSVSTNTIKEAINICSSNSIELVVLSPSFSINKNELLKGTKNPSMKIAEISLPYSKNDGKKSDIQIPLKYTESMKEIRSLLGIDDLPAQKRRKIQPTFINLHAEIPINILVVEDNLVNQKVVLQALRNFGFDPQVVSSGNDAVSLCSNKYFDLILMDVQMPDIDGFQTTKLIRDIQLLEKNKSIIIALTANAMSGFREICLESGMDDYLKKPIDFDELRVTLHHWGKLIIQKRT